MSTQTIENDSHGDRDGWCHPRKRHTRDARSILLAFNEGATPEEIAQQYPTVPLADIYHLIGYCLRHAAEMEEYLRRRQHESQEVRHQNEAHWKPDGVRQQLLARRPNRA